MVRYEEDVRVSELVVTNIDRRLVVERLLPQCECSSKGSTIAEVVVVEENRSRVHLDRLDAIASRAEVLG